MQIFLYRLLSWQVTIYALLLWVYFLGKARNLLFIKTIDYRYDYNKYNHMLPSDNWGAQELTWLFANMEFGGLCLLVGGSLLFYLLTGQKVTQKLLGFRSQNTDGAALTFLQKVRGLLWWPNKGFEFCRGVLPKWGLVIMNTALSFGLIAGVYVLFLALLAMSRV